MKRTPLLPNPHKTREWRDRSRTKLAQETFSQARAPLKRGKPKPRQKIPDDVRRLVRKRSGGRCVVCLWRGHGGKGAGKASHLHHGLPKGTHGWPELALEPDNLMGVCERCHMNHEAAFARIPREALPACFVALCYRLGGRAVVYLERTYPRLTRRGVEV